MLQMVYALAKFFGIDFDISFPALPKGTTCAMLHVVCRLSTCVAMYANWCCRHVLPCIHVIPCAHRWCCSMSHTHIYTGAIPPGTTLLFELHKHENEAATTRVHHNGTHPETKNEPGHPSDREISQEGEMMCVSWCRDVMMAARDVRKPGYTY